MPADVCICLHGIWCRNFTHAKRKAVVEVVVPGHFAVCFLVRLRRPSPSPPPSPPSPPCLPLRSCLLCRRLCLWCTSPDLIFFFFFLLLFLSLSDIFIFAH